MAALREETKPGHSVCFGVPASLSPRQNGWSHRVKDDRSEMGQLPSGPAATAPAAPIVHPSTLKGKGVIAYALGLPDGERGRVSGLLGRIL